jgi:copper chaperone
MISFRVTKMTCGHCVKAITQAVVGVDRLATVQADLATHQVHIDPVSGTREAFAGAIAAAGYPVEPAANA